MPVAEVIQIPRQTIALSQGAYDLAMRLFAAQADKKAVAITKDIPAKELSELTNKHKIAERRGRQPGRYGNRGTIRLLVKQDEITAAPRRRRRLRQILTEKTGTIA